MTTSFDASTATFTALLTGQAEPLPELVARRAARDAQLRACMEAAQAWLRATAGGVPRAPEERGPAARRAEAGTVAPPGIGSAPR